MDYRILVRMSGGNVREEMVRKKALVHLDYIRQLDAPGASEPRGKERGERHPIDGCLKGIPSTCRCLVSKLCACRSP